MGQFLRSGPPLAQAADIVASVQHAAEIASRPNLITIDVVLVVLMNLVETGGDG
jgi:hypothetical protein